MEEYEKKNKEVTNCKLSRVKKGGLKPLAKEKYRCIGEILSYVASEGAHVLDIGSRSGFLFDVLKEYGFKNFYAIDISEEAVNFIRSRGYEAHQLDIQKEHLIFGFDVVVASHVLEHVPEPYKALKNIDKMVMPDGILYVEVPKDQNIREQAGHFYKFTCFDDLDRMFDRDKWKCLYYEDNKPIRSLWRRKWNI